MSCIVTFTKKQFDPCEPNESEIDIFDIAHALSLLCRSGGHFPSYYCVGQHCVSCSNEAKGRGYSKRVQLACLLHDASEAYIADITRPVKHKLTEYLKYESKLQTMIYKKFLGSELTADEEALVKTVDDTMLFYEFRHFMDVELFECKEKQHTEVDYEFHGFKTAEEEFLKLYYNLTEMN